MNELSVSSTRAAFEVARVALARMTGGASGASPATSYAATPSAATPSAVTPSAGTAAPPATMAARASDAWSSIETLLRLLTGRPDLSAQDLLVESRRQDMLDMEGMHALVALREWVERTVAPDSDAPLLPVPPTESERAVASAALAALERSVRITASTKPGTPVPPRERAATATATSPFAPPPFASPPFAPSQSAPSPIAPPPFATNRDTSEPVPTELQNRRSLSSGAIMAIVLLVVAVAGAGGWMWLRNTSSGSAAYTDEGVEAYARGAKEAARIPLAKAVEENPEDVRALTYLGRIAREQGNLATARKYLETAIRVDPENALALRELASALLADEQYELARRFYVRAITVNPDDHTAQGFLGCSLRHLNRNDEAARWFERAGPGAWSACEATTSASPIGK